MPDNLNDGATPAPAENGTPNPQSPAPAGQPPSAGEVPAWFKTYTEQMDQRLNALDQSFKTTQGQARQTESQFRKWMSEVDQLEKSGVPREQAISQLEKNQQEGDWRTGIETQLKNLTSLLSSSGNANGSGQMVTEVLSEFNLNPNDPAVASALQGKTFGSKTEVEAFAGRLFKELASTPNPSAATSMSQLGQPNGRMTQQQADARYVQLEELSKNISQNRPQIKAIMKELQDNGYMA